MTDIPDRRSALLAAKLMSLVRGEWDDVGSDARSGTFPGGARLHDAASGRVWILLDDAAEAARRLGACLGVASRAHAVELHLLVDDAVAAAILARRAACFAVPPVVWQISGRSLARAVAAAPACDPAPAPEAEPFRPVLEAAGLETVVEGGVLVGEWLGLEVARVVVEPDGSAHIEVGVGRFDREVGAMMFAELSDADSLERAVAFVAPLRRGGAGRHPLNQLVPERWLRAVLVAQPDLVGAAQLRSVGSAIPRANLKENGVATAVGTDRAGNPIVVTCSTGVDLELVPSAADDRLVHGHNARLVLVVPAADALAVTTELAAHLVHPASVVAVGDDWPMINASGAI